MPCKPEVDLVAGPENGVHTIQSLRFCLGLSPGSLDNHLSKLERAGLIRVEKGSSGNRPLTEAVLTQTGLGLLEDLAARLRRFAENQEGRRSRPRDAIRIEDRLTSPRGR